MKIITLVISLFLYITTAFMAEQITPYKYTDKERENNLPSYEIPESSKFFVKRHNENSPNIIFYYSKPEHSNFPIAILCGGSSTKKNVASIVHFHRYFLKEFLDLGVGVITLEQWGVDGHYVDTNEFIKHYTRTQRLFDHKTVMDHLLQHPPAGWNGKFILLGVSEGGPLVTALTTAYPDAIRATVNWSGAGDWNWRDELWAFVEKMRPNIPWYFKLRSKLPSWFPFSINLNLPKTREEFDKIMDQTLANPTFEKEFLDMTYKYHADSLSWPATDYSKLKTPYLVVAGAQDTIIQSSDEFVEKAKEYDTHITYLRIPGMDHYIRKRPDVIQQSFDWLKKTLL